MSTVAEEMRNPAMSAAPYGCNSIMTTILPSHSKLEVVFAHTSSVKSPTLHQESRVKSHTSKSHTSRSHTYKSPTHKSHTYKSHQESSHLPPSHLPTRVKSLPTSKSHTSKSPTHKSQVITYLQVTYIQSTVKSHLSRVSPSQSN